MGIRFDQEAANAVFSPARCDGSFDSDFAAYLNRIGAARPSVVLCFAPKAAGTFLRSAALVAVSGQLVRTVHAQGGRDASFYLPTFLMYFAGNYPADPMVTHVHMQALPANQHFIAAFGLKPIIMIRSIPDMLASYADMLDGNSLSPDNWINLRLPPYYAGMGRDEKNDFLIDMVGPWYASYFATWIEYAAAEPARVCVLDYEDFLADPAATLGKLLAHSGLAQPRARCQAALDAVWEERDQFRFNKGVGGRGAARFSQGQRARLARMLDYYPHLAALHEVLIPPTQAPLRARTIGAL